MNYRRHSYIFLGLISLLSALRFVAIRTYNLAAIPVMAFIRLAPATAAVVRALQPLKVIAFRAINLLKPVYRESHETHGLSLTSVRD